MKLSTPLIKSSRWKRVPTGLFVYILLLIGIGSQSCSQSPNNQRVNINEAIDWKEEGKPEVEKYLRALDAKQVFLTTEKGSYPYQQSSGQVVINISISESDVFKKSSKDGRQLIVNRIGLVVWDNLLYQNLYRKIEIIFRDNEGLLLDSYRLTDEVLADLEPSLGLANFP